MYLNCIRTVSGSTRLGLPRDFCVFDFLMSGFLAAAISIASTQTAVAQEKAESQKTLRTTELTYKPPILPIELAINSRGEPSIKFSPECSTPIGTFGIGGGVAAVNNDGNTYLIFRAAKKEAVYCVGTQGKLRIHADGIHTIDISQHEKYSNTLIIDISTLEGTIEAEFIPDSTSDFLAAVPEKKVFSSVYLEKGGDILSGPSNCTTGNQFHMRFKQENIQRIIFCDFDGKSIYGIGDGLLVVVAKSEEGKIVPVQFGIPKNSIMATRWFCYCFKHALAREPSIVMRVHDHNDIRMLFDDGSLFNGVIYYPKSAIRNIELDTSSYFGANINITCIQEFFWGESSPLGFFSDAPAETFYEKMKKFYP